MPEHAPIAKITRPRLQAILPRTRLFSLLDKGCLASVTWVMGPGGSGKTTLVASWLDAKKLPCLWYHLDEGDSDIATFFYYLGLAAKKAAPHYRNPLPLLTPEYLRGGIPAFTRNYFEKLCSRFKPPFAIVLDNYHHIRSDSQFHEVIREALSVIPQGISVVIASRGTRPSALALLQTYNKIQGIGWEELKFDMIETGELFKYGRKKGLNVELLTHIQQTTLGWAAGLMLLLERMRRQESAPGDIDRFNPQEFFDYFATELFAKTDPDTQDFLLKTSFLSQISPRAAVELTGEANAGAILLSLSRNHFFTEQRSPADPVYQYHPLFKEFLQARARQVYSREQMQELLRSAGEILEKEGQTEDAAGLFEAAEDWKSFERMVLANARLMVSQGRSRSLESWLRNIPEDIRDRSPWLLYWLGVCRMPFNLPEGRKYFEMAFGLFRGRHDPSGIFLSWSGAMESIIQELGDLSRMDPWIALLDELMKEYPVFPSPQIEGHVTSRIFMALSHRQPWHPAFDRWKEKAMTLLTSEADASLRLLTGFYLFQHLILVGDRPRCEQVMVTIRRLTGAEEASPLAYTMGKMADAWLASVTCNGEQGLKSMNEGLEKSRATGVHIWDYLLLHMGVWAAESIGDIPLAEELGRKMESALERGRPLDKFYYYNNAGWHRMLHGDPQGAIALSAIGLEMVAKISFLGAEIRGRLAQAHYLKVMGKYKEAKEHLARALEIGHRMNGPLITFFCLLKSADIAFAEGEEKIALRFLRDAMTLGREKGYAAFTVTHWLPEELSFLCMKALEAEIEPDFVREMIRKRKLVPQEPPLHLENWPWPVRIFTLGGFRLLIHDKAVEFSGKVQKKPLELLKALIALGGTEVREDVVIDALWPDAEGDAARISFKTTLHRLRQLLGRDELIHLQDGRISLDRRSCWVDAWAFERMLENAERGMRNAKLKENRKADQKKESEAVQRLEKALLLYRGHFLSGDGDKPWSVSMQERLRSKYLRAVNGVGNYWLRQSDSEDTNRAKSAVDKAIECYEKGLEIDEVAEEFYQNLMLCKQRLGRKAEVIKVYKRCRDALKASLGIEQSKETEEIFKRLQGS